MRKNNSYEMYKKIKKTMAVVLCVAITVTTLPQNMIIIKADEISDTIDNNDNGWQSEEYTNEQEDISEASSEDIKENTDEDIVKDNEQTDEDISDSDVTDKEEITTDTDIESTQEETEDDITEETKENIEETIEETKESDIKIEKTINFSIKRGFTDENGKFSSWDSKEDRLDGAVIELTGEDGDKTELITHAGKADIKIMCNKDEEKVYTYRVYKVGYTIEEGIIRLSGVEDETVEIMLYPVETKTVKVVVDGVDETDLMKIRLESQALNTTDVQADNLIYNEETGRYYAEFTSVYQSGNYRIKIDSDKYTDMVIDNIYYDRITADEDTTCVVAVTREKYHLMYMPDGEDVHECINLNAVKNDTTGEYEYASVEYGDRIEIRHITGKQISRLVIGDTDYARKIKTDEDGSQYIYFVPARESENRLYIDIQMQELKAEQITIQSNADAIIPAPGVVYMFRADIAPQDASSVAFEWNVTSDDRYAEYRYEISEDKKTLMLTLDKIEYGKKIYVSIYDNYSGCKNTGIYRTQKNSVDVHEYLMISGTRYNEESEWYTSDVIVKSISDNKQFSFMYPNGQYTPIMSEYVETVGGKRVCYIYNKRGFFDITNFFKFNPVAGEDIIDIKIDKMAPVFKEMQEEIKFPSKVTFGIYDYGTIAYAGTDREYYTEGSGIVSVTYAKCDEDGNITEDGREAEYNNNAATIDIPYENYNGMYIIKAADATGHIATTMLKVNTDITAPEIVAMVNGEETERVYYNNDTSFVVDISDNQDIVQAEITVIKDNSDRTTENINIDGNKAHYEYIFVQDGEYNITVTAIDSHGNDTVYNKTIVVDKTNPQVKLNYNSQGRESDGIIFFDSGVDIRLAIHEKNYNSEDTVVYVNDKEYESHVDTYADEHVMLLHFAHAGEYKVEVRSVDMAGNVSVGETQAHFIIDLEGPQITVEYDNNECSNERYFKEERQATVTIKEDNLDLSTVEVNISEANGEKADISEWRHNGSIHTAYIRFKKDGDYTLNIRCSDKAGHENDEPVSYSKAPWQFVIDTTNPVVTVEYSKDGYIKQKDGIDYYNMPATALITVKEKNFDEDAVKITITSKDAYGGELAMPSIGRFEKDGDVYRASIIYDTESNYTFDIECSDKAGLKNKENNTKKLTFDKTSPSGVISAGQFGSFAGYEEMIDYGMWTRDNVDIKIACSDNISGILYIKYIKTEKEMTLDELKAKKDTEWKEYSAFTVDKDERFIIYAKSEDKAGNIYYFNTNGIIIDKERPVVERLAPAISMKEPAKGIYNTDIEMDIAITDKKVNNSYSGINYVAYKVIKDDAIITQSEVLYQNTNKKPKEKDLKQKFSQAIIVDSELNNSNNIRVEVTAADNSGNVITEIKELKIDITQPVINVEYDNNNVINDRYYNAKRISTITVYERNFDESDMNIDITSSSGKKPYMSDWITYTDIQNPDNTRHIMTIEYNDNSDYTFDISYTDMAGNVAKETNYNGSTAPDDFTIDLTDPEIMITFDNNNYVNGNYYKAGRTAVITILEHNFNEKDVDMRITANGTILNNVNFVNDGDRHIATVRFDKDGYYEIEAGYTDMAGRTAIRTDKHDFYIDMTLPELRIDGITDRVAYNTEVVAPVITTSDNNYDSTIIVLTDKSGKVISFAGNTVKNNGDNIYTFDNIAEDGIYILNVSVSDKAGNKTEKNIEFSVNRHGSTYKFDTNTERIRKKYIKEETDIVIHEINVTELDNDSIRVKLVRDGSVRTLEEGKDYNINKAVTGDGWHEYTYTIYKNNFAAEGAYTVIVHSKDGAENVSENNLSSKGADVTFAVDKSQPVCIVSGLKDNAVYKSRKQNVLLTVSDNFRIAGIYVYVNGELYKHADENENVDMLNEIYENGKLDFEISDMAKRQDVEVVLVDMAGNEQRVAVNNVLVSTSAWVRFVNNRQLFIGTTVALSAAVLIAICLFVKSRKRRNKQEL